MKRRGSKTLAAHAILTGILAPAVLVAIPVILIAAWPPDIDPNNPHRTHYAREEKGMLVLLDTGPQQRATFPEGGTPNASSLHFQTGS